MAWTACIVLLFVLAILIVVSPHGRFGGGSQDATSLRVNEPAPSFSLIDHEGLVVTEKRFRGRPLAIFFGFTNCPDVCPTTLTEISSMMAEIGEAADRIQVIFITVDPERDTSAVLKDYILAIDKRFVALTGSQDDVQRVADGFRVYFKKSMQRGAGDYTMDHTSTVFLIDSEHRFKGTLDTHENRVVSRDKLKRLARS